MYVQFFGGEEEEDSVPPPPTSPFLEAAGAAKGASSSGHVQTGHSPAAPSRPPRIRGTKGGRKEQTKRLIKRWQQDFDILARFLWDEAEFWLHYVQHEDAHPELIWTVKVIRVLLNHCTTNQILVHFAKVFALYRNWMFYNGYRRKDGLRRAPETTANTVLPGRDHINLQAFGQADPPRSDWDDYNTNRGPQAKAKGKAKAKASVFTQNTDPPTPEEDNSNLGVDPAAQRAESSSEETHTPSPREPKAKPRPKAQPKQPKEPSTPPPGWTPSLRAVEHPVGPKVTESIASVPPPRAAGGAAAKRPNSPGPKQPQPAATKAKASEPKASDGKAASSAPSEPKASEPKVAKSAKFKLGPPPTYPAPSVPPHRDFHQVLGPPPRRPPRPVTPRGDRVAPQIVISLRRHLIPRQQGKIWIALKELLLKQTCQRTLALRQSHCLKGLSTSRPPHQSHPPQKQLVAQDQESCFSYTKTGRDIRGSRHRLVEEG